MESDGITAALQVFVRGTCAVAAALAAAGITASLMGIFSRRKASIHARWARDACVRVVLIRHAESENNRLAYEQDTEFHAKRKADPSLTELGLKQAEAIGAWIGSSEVAAETLLPLDSFFVSPCLRTMMTALPIARGLKMSPEVVTDIYEAGGLYDGATNGAGVGGLTRSEMQKAFPGYIIPEDVTEAGWYERAGFMHGKEDRSVCIRRAKAVAERVVAMAKDLEVSGTSRRGEGGTEAPAMKRVCFVVHGEFMNDILSAFFKVNHATTMFEHFNTGITSLDVYADASVRLVGFNSVEHLRPNKLCLNKALGRI